MNDDDEEAHTDALAAEKKAERGKTVDSSHSPSEEDMRASVRAVRKVTSARTTTTKAGHVDAPTIVKGVVRVVDAVFEDRSIAKERSGSVRCADAPDFVQTSSSEATGDTDSVLNGD